MTGCGPRIHDVKFTILDPALTVCPDAPAVPDAPVTNRQDSQFKNDLLTAHDDCFSKLGRVREINEKNMAAAAKK